MSRCWLSLTLVVVGSIFGLMGQSRAQAPAAPSNPPAPAAGPANPPSSNAPAAGAPRQLPPPEWVDPNQEEPNGAEYHLFNSASLGAKVSYLVWLPDDYDNSKDRYPVIYWLHGLGGNQRGGAQMFLPHVKEAIRAGTLPPTIVVVVNGMQNSFYCDWVDGTRPMESVIVKDLVPHVDQTYRTHARREGRAIEGYSMGGFGAAHLALKYPDVFGSVVVDAGALINDMGGGPALNPIFVGGFGSDAAKFQAEHPKTLVKKNAEQIRGRMNIRIGCGGDDNLLARNRELHELLDELSIAHQYEIVPGVGHTSPRYYQELGTGWFSFYRKAFESLAETSPAAKP